MATLVLGALGTATGVPGLGIVGAVAGALIDNLFIFPSLFPPPDQRGPRLDGVNITSGNAGFSLEWPLGPRPPRVGAAVLWMSDLIEVTRTEEVGKGGGASSTTYEYFVDIALCFGEASPQTIADVRRIMADAKTIYADGPTDAYEAIRIYDGTQTTPDPYLEAKMGTGNVPAYLGRCYVVIERLFLGDYGQRVPNLQGLLEQSAEMSVGNALGWVLKRGGYEEADYDVSRVSSCLRGATYAGIVTTKQSSLTIMKAYMVGMQEIDGKFSFFDLGGEVPISVDESHLVAGPDGGGLSIEDPYSGVVPDGCVVNFIADELDRQPGSTSYKNQAMDVDGQSNTLRVDFPNLTLTEVEANAAARKIYWQAVAERRPVRFTLPPWYWFVAGGDVIRVVRDGIEHLVRVKTAEYGANGMINAIGSSTWPGIYSQTGKASGGAAYRGVDGYVAPDLDWFVMDSAAVFDDDVADVTVYFVARPIGGSQYRGSTLYSSIDGASFSPRASVTHAAVTGRTVGGFSRGQSEVWDMASTIVVDIDDPSSFSPASATDAEVLAAQKNIVAVRGSSGDWELLGFVVATPMGNGRFRLSRLLRGLRGTEYVMGSHNSSEARVVFLSASTLGGVGRWSAGVAGLGSPSLRAVPYLGSVEAEVSRQETIRGRTMRPLSPVLLKSRRYADGAGGEVVIVSWSRRSRRVSDPFGSGGVPLESDESPERYRVEVRLGGSGAPMIYSAFVSEPRFVFSQSVRDAIEATNGLGWGEEFGFRVFVYQISSVVGDGPPGELWVPPRS